MVSLGTTSQILASPVLYVHSSQPLNQRVFLQFAVLISDRISKVVLRFLTPGSLQKGTPSASIPERHSVLVLPQLENGLLGMLCAWHSSDHSRFCRGLRPAVQGAL